MTAESAGSSRATALPWRRLFLACAWLSAVSAVGGGVELIVWRDGNGYLPITLLQHTPFTSFLVPGLILLAVVGGTSLVAALAVTRRARWALDAALLAGGALTLWIVAELGMLREAHWLHALYGGLGLVMLGLAIVASLRGGADGHPRPRWTVLVTGGEALGFVAPALAGIASQHAGVSELGQAVLVVAAGFVEGLLLGLGQAWAFPLPLRRWRYALWSSLAAGCVWASAMAMQAMLASDVAAPRALVIVVCVAVATFGLAAIGAAQWIELRRHAPRAWRWIGWTALAWTLALPWSFGPAPFVDERTPLVSHLLLWPCAGVMMAYVMALVTWRGARALTEDGSS